MNKKNVTIDDLAIMIQKGFEKTSTKDQMENLEIEIKELKGLLAFK